MLDRIKPYCVNEFKLKPTNCLFRFGGNISKPAMGEVDICLVYLGYNIPMTILIVEDDVPFLLGMETIRQHTNGIKWEDYPIRRQWLELQCTTQNLAGLLYFIPPPPYDFLKKKFL